MNSVTCQTYNYNGEDIPFHQLPGTLRVAVLQSWDFFQKLENAATPEEREEIMATHPANN